MKRLFLSSQMYVVAQHIYAQISPTLTGRKTAFITTAAEVIESDKKWQDKDRDSLVACGLDVFEYTITGKGYEQVVHDLKDIDILHVNGGDNFYLLMQAKKSGFDRFVRDHVNAGKVYLGSSAGSIAVSKNIEVSISPGREKYANMLDSFDGIGLVDFIVLPHWGKENSEAERRKQRVQNSFKEDKNRIILLNDYQYVQVEGEMYRIVDIRD